MEGKAARETSGDGMNEGRRGQQERDDKEEWEGGSRRRRAILYRWHRSVAVATRDQREERDRERETTTTYESRWEMRLICIR